MSSQPFDVARALREQGYNPGTSGNRNQPNVEETTRIIEDRQDGHAGVISPTGEMDSEKSEAFRTLSQQDPDFAKKYSFLRDMKITF